MALMNIDILLVQILAVRMTSVNSERLTFNMKFSRQNDICKQRQTYCQYEVQPSEWHSSTVTLTVNMKFSHQNDIFQQ